MSGLPSQHLPYFFSLLLSWNDQLTSIHNADKCNSELWHTMQLCECCEQGVSSPRATLSCHMLLSHLSAGLLLCLVHHLLVRLETLGFVILITVTKESIPKPTWTACNTTFCNIQFFGEVHDHIFKPVYKSGTILLFKKATIKKIKGAVPACNHKEREK